jgi:hypothetical protein
VFFASPKEYIRNLNLRIEEEKMAVIIQQVVGDNYNGRFYPAVSGVAQSYNYYPIAYLKPADGAAELSLGLGLTIVEGGKNYRFSPKYPAMSPPYSSASEWMKKSQSSFYAINMSEPARRISNDEKYSLVELDLLHAEKDGTLFFSGSTCNIQDNTIRDSLADNGPRVVTFANILKYNAVPLSDILNELLPVVSEAFGSHIEIEFAMNLDPQNKRRPEFNLLQVRPMVIGKESIETSLEGMDSDKAVCISSHSLGHGVHKNLYDLVYVEPDSFSSIHTKIIAKEVGEMNRLFVNENRNYILIGFGRWGTLDPALGIPVQWHEISRARVVIESDLDDFRVEPSLGSHFFHNLTSLGMGYFHIAKRTDAEFIKWDWIKNQKIFSASNHVKCIRFSRPFEVRINALNSNGVILQPG